ncbi:hypothetical protein MANY_52330 [Mycolicibacterium anyangense]|jgi:hypothetical protein|uniref:Uncharacterized protein n=1 Tax=Mycolicibacterium anyangense TaxID=1431246 RepID=A0A6N4WCZ0_9MYCO|nr:hypothetical protein [Mycolicibacterium anyangense]BBZ79896.1 hypothetical protein MANY_52330 [Mycolicibacterium anyangense]
MSDSIPDEVPVADAVEQRQDVVEPTPPDISERPLESNESDWHEQRLVVDDPDQDELR